MDEPQEPQALNDAAVEDNSVSTPPVDEQNTSVETEPVDEAPAESDEPVDAERKPTRAERRIHQLTDKLEQVQRANQPMPGFGQPPQFPSYSEDEYVTPERLQADVVQAAQAIAGQTVQQALAQQEAKSNFNLDMQSLQNNELIQDLPEVEQAITEEFEQRAFKVIGYDPMTGQPVQALDPSVRLADIAKRHLKVAEAAAKRSSAEMKNAVARTADEAAPRLSSGTTRSEVDPSTMSAKEYEAWAAKKYGVVGH